MIYIWHDSKLWYVTLEINLRRPEYKIKNFRKDYQYQKGAHKCRKYIKFFMVNSRVNKKRITVHTIEKIVSRKICIRSQVEPFIDRL